MDVGGLNVDGCRVGTDTVVTHRTKLSSKGYSGGGFGHPDSKGQRPTLDSTDHQGRWPANLVLDEDAAGMLDEQSGEQKSGTAVNRNRPEEGSRHLASSYGASRFFYTVKASKADRGPGNLHPTVKPTDLMRWLVRLVCPAGGIVLDPFNGSGATTYAAREEDCRYIGIDQDGGYCETARRRLAQGVLEFA